MDMIKGDQRELGSIWQRPDTVEDLAAILRADGPIRVVGTGHHNDFMLPSSAEGGRITVRGIAGIVEHYASDQVVVVRAGTTVEELQDALALSGQCLPLGEGVIPSAGATLGGQVSMNLPHTREAQCGTWRDWILGMTIVQADGTVAKCGSLAVKNVAGYDVQKLFIGARGTLGVIVELILRTYPVKALPQTETVRGDAWTYGPLWVQRVLRADFAEATTTEQLIRADRAASTLVCSTTPNLELPRFPHDWVVRSGCGEKNLQFTDPTQIRLMQRAKALLDPAGRLNAGALGV